LIRLNQMKLRGYFLLLWIFCHSVHGQDLFDASHTQKFATYLLKSGQFEFAGEEFERLSLLYPKNDTIKWQVIHAFRLAQKPASGLTYFSLFYPDSSKAPEYSAREAGWCCLLINKPKRYEKLVLPLLASDPNRQKLAQAEGLAWQARWKEARKIVKEIPENGVPPDFNNLLNEAYRKKKKNPYLAAGLSIIPGLGRFYTGDWKDALVSILFISANGFTAYRGFEKQGQGSVRGWIFGSLGTGFYLGNIYGSFLSAKKKNRRIDHEYQTKVQELLVRLHQPVLAE